MIGAAIWIVLVALPLLSHSATGWMRVSVNRTIHRFDARMLLDQALSSQEGSDPFMISFGKASSYPSDVLTPEYLPDSDRDLYPGFDTGIFLSQHSPLENQTCPPLPRKPNFHRLGHCLIHWPINQSGIQLHGLVTPNLSPLRVKQKLVISCLGNRNTSVEITQHGGSQQHRWLATVRASEPEAIEYFLHFYSEENDRSELCIDFSLSDSPHVSVTIQLHKRYGHQVPFALQYLHPWATQLDSRDDLGFALQSLLPFPAVSLVEVGVNAGNFAQLLLHTSPTLSLYLGIDSWKAWRAEDYPDTANLSTDEQLDRMAIAMESLSLFPGQAHLIRAESTHAARLFAPESVHVVYLDAMHSYAAVEEDLSAWWPIVRRCGLLAGHDYLLDVRGKTVFTVKPAVQEFAARRGLVVLQTDDEDKASGYPTWLLFKPCEEKEAR